MKRSRLTTQLAVGTTLAIGAALAWAPAATEVGPYAHKLEATVIGIDDSEREITVRFDKEGVTETYRVAPGAQIFTYTGTLRNPQSFAGFTVGEQVMLEFGNIEGDAALTEVTGATENVS